MSKKLVTFFSASKVTKKVAEVVAKAADADIFEIVPETLYTPADLNWQDEKSRSSVEMKDKSFRPAIAADCKVDSMNAYDCIFVGFPIWWYTAPTIVNTFIEAHDLDDGKEYEWPDAMKRLKEVGKETFSHKQGLLMAAYRDEINAALREIGGDELKGYYWSSTVYPAGNPLYVYFSSGYIYTNGSKSGTPAVRPVAAF